LNFADTLLPVVIQTQGWESLLERPLRCPVVSLLERPLRCPVVFIQDFYSNIHNIDTSAPQFATIYRGTRIVVTLDLISVVLHVSKVAHPDYPSYERLRIVSKDELLSHFCETPSTWGGKLNTPSSGFAKCSRFFNMVMTFTFTPLSHYNSITEACACFLLSLMEDLSIDFPSHFITSILDVYQDTATHNKLIFPLVITQIL